MLVGVAVFVGVAVLVAVFVTVGLGEAVGVFVAVHVADAVGVGPVIVTRPVDWYCKRVTLVKHKSRMECLARVGVVRKSEICRLSDRTDHIEIEV